jgi:putative flippase GtrA
MKLAGGKLDSVVRMFGASRHERMVFVGYVATGGLTQCIDIASFLGLVRLHVPVEIAATIAIVVSTATHFTLSKYVNFRSFERPVSQQLGTYLTVGAASLIMSVAIVSILTRVLHLPPIVAKIASVAIAFPFNFLCHKYLTFAGGFRSVYETWKLERRAKRVASTP